MSPEPQRGMRAVTAEEFSPLEAMGGVRGFIESVLPGLIFVVIYLITEDLWPPLIASVAVALIATIVRIIGGTSVQQAAAGIIGVAVAAIWAWRTGEAKDYFALGLWTNAIYLAACLISLLARRPLVGYVVGALTGDINGWSRDKFQRRAYGWATGVWTATFALRLIIQLPLYLGAQVAWLGSMRLVMGVPLWALALWITWLLVRGPARASMNKRAQENNALETAPPKEE